MTAITLESLKTKALSVEGGLPANARMRVRRALSWLERAQQESADVDARFIFHWIAFSAVYAECHGSDQSGTGMLEDFFKKLLAGGAEQSICDHVSGELSYTMLELVANPYVFEPFWDYYNGDVASADEWQELLIGEVERVSLRMEDGDFAGPLAVAFARLRVIRNQLFHGDATWSRHINRSQVEDGAEILAALVPVLIEVMLERPEMFEHPSRYPSVEMDTVTIVEDVSDYAIAVNIVRRVREGKEPVYSSEEVSKRLGLDD